MRRPDHRLRFVFSILLSGVLPAGALGATCDGLPRLAAVTPPGFCVAVVAEGFRSPRALQPLPNGDIVLVDMGGWQANRGSVWRLKRVGDDYEKTQLFDRLDRPNSIALGPDGLLYLGVVQRVVRFDANAADPILTDVIGGDSGTAPLPGVGRHLLTSLLFGRDGNLVVNIGSGSDHCEGADGAAPAPDSPCAEGEGKEPLGAIRKYTMKWPQGTAGGWENYARGLRNSMAMAIDPRDGVLWQGENSRDAINVAMPALKNDNELPHDELNRIDRGAHYGWPYCYDNSQPSPEYPKGDCSGYRRPVRLLPAHAAPLGMTFYTGTRFPPAFRNSLVISFHGYRQHGHRVVALLANRKGAPLGASVDLIRRSANDKQSLGAPVAVRVGSDGDIYLTDDHTGKVLKLHYQAN